MIDTDIFILILVKIHYNRWIDIPRVDSNTIQITENSILA